MTCRFGVKVRCLIGNDGRNFEECFLSSNCWSVFVGASELCGLMMRTFILRR